MAPLTSSARRVASRTTASESDERPKARKRKADDGDKPSDSRACRRFQYLKPRTRHISQDLIQTRWGPLPAPAQQQVRELLKAAKRPVFLSRHEERRRREAEVVLDHMVKRLEKQLPRMPFPPRSKEVDLNLDALVERNVSLVLHFWSLLLDSTGSDC